MRNNMNNQKRASKFPPHPLDKPIRPRTAYEVKGDRQADAQETQRKIVRPPDGIYTQLFRPDWQADGGKMAWGVPAGPHRSYTDACNYARELSGRQKGEVHVIRLTTIQDRGNISNPNYADAGTGERQVPEMLTYYVEGEEK